MAPTTATENHWLAALTPEEREMLARETDRDKQSGFYEQHRTQYEREMRGVITRLATEVLRARETLAGFVPRRRERWVSREGARRVRISRVVGDTVAFTDDHVGDLITYHAPVADFILRYTRE